ncbi:MAG: ATP-binding protein [Pseudomonadota bacterium]|nr:ATP-binding protein [Pseudomonadota bacterium]
MRRRKSKRVNAGVSVMDEKQQNLTFLWGLRILLELRGWKKLERKGFTYDYDILAAVGLEHLEDKKMDKKQFLGALEDQKEKITNKSVGPNKHLARNCQKIAEYIGLNKAEQIILMFIVILKGNRGLQDVTGIFGEVNVEAFSTILSTILELDHQETCDALSRQGLLARSGLLSIDRSSQFELNNKFDLLEGLNDLLQEPDVTVAVLLRNYFALAGPPELTESNYLHVEDKFDLIRDHLGRACEQQTKGVNILLYGPPGTGKTEFAKTIAKTIGCKLYEVNIGDEEKPYDKPKRLRAFQLAQQILSRQKDALIIFDEIDSLLTEGFSFFHDGDSLNLKAWINKNLENNLVPAIWIANNIHFAEDAFIRRFDIVFHLNHPPRSTRLDILKNYLRDIPVSTEWMELLADNKYIAPAVIARAARVVRCQELKTTGENEKRLEKLLESTQTAMGYPEKPVVEARNQIRYRLGAVNPDHDLRGIVDGLRRHSEGRLCLYGPPGTGKTEFGHYLARQLDKPLLVKRSSDLLSKYVGETEANIAGMFDEAIYEKAILLLDEADSFLRDRNGARQSWEVTQVNELLTQMERYQGVFICSTNLMDSLDAASLRRFDLKIKFDFLKPEQAWDLFQSIFKEKGIELKRKKHWQDELKKYLTLTPGDFATVTRKLRINGVELNPDAMLTGLVKEIDFKDSEPSRNIGFFSGFNKSADGY